MRSKVIAMISLSVLSAGVLVLLYFNTLPADVALSFVSGSTGGILALANGGTSKVTL